MNEQRLDRAAALIELGRFEAARAELAPVLAAEPDNSEAHAQLAYAWLRSGESATAADSARTALRLHPDNLFAWKLLALSEHGLFGELYDTDRTAALAHEDEAARAGYRCVELDPWSAECHRILAAALLRRDREAAQTAIDTAIELEPDDAVLHVARARVLWHGAKRATKRVEAGRSALEEALRLDPENVEALFLIGAYALQRRRWADAEQWLRRAAELDPSCGADVRELLARIPARASSQRACTPIDATPAVPSSAPVPRPIGEYPPMPPPPPDAWREQYLGAPSSGRGGRAGIWVAIWVVVLLVCAAIADTDSPSTGRTSRTPPSPRHIPTDFQFPRTVSPLPADLLPTKYLWPSRYSRPPLAPTWPAPAGN